MSMMNKPVGIIGTGSCVPDNVVTNFDLEKIVDTNDQWIRERTGIEERRIAPEGVNTSHLATEAAKRALQMANLEPEDIDCIIMATLTPDMPLPSTACLVQANLGAVNAAAFDLQAACSGFAYGLVTAASYINTGIYKNVLVIGGEVLSRILNWKDRSTCVLFGDGAGAAVVSTVEEGYGIKAVDNIRMEAFGDEEEQERAKGLGKTLKVVPILSQIGPMIAAFNQSWAEELDYRLPEATLTDQAR